MASYQQEYLAIKDMPLKIYNAVQDWKGSEARQEIIDAKEYYIGENPDIKKIFRYYYSETKKKMVDGKEVTVGGGLIQNPYVANNQIGYSIFQDVVDQKNDTLLTEHPNIDTDFSLEEKFVKNLGYALHSAGIEASCGGVGFMFQDFEGNYTVFETENCIAYYDDLTSELMTLIRFWEIKDKIFIEVFKETTSVLYSFGKEKRFKIERAELPYQYTKKQAMGEEQIENLNIKLPIIIVKNNKQCKSDLDTNLRTKINAIDLVNSGFANNIEDFSELFWIIKDKGFLNAEQFEDFVANINRTRKALVQGDGADVDTKQIQIPTEARRLFVEDRKKEIIIEKGLIDTASMTGSSLTTTAIKAATQKLVQRVSKFEWQVYEAMSDAIRLFQLYNKVNFEFDVSFTKLLIQNDTEIIDNAVKIRTDISKKSLLTLYKRANYINDVDEEIEQIEEEQVGKFSLIDEEVEENGQSTQRNGQTVEQVTQEKQITVPNEI